MPQYQKWCCSFSESTLKLHGKVMEINLQNCVVILNNTYNFIVDKDFPVQDFNLLIYKNYIIIQTLTNFVLEGYRSR